MGQQQEHELQKRFDSGTTKTTRQSVANRFFWKGCAFPGFPGNQAEE
jgi:hypothetical protein